MSTKIQRVGVLKLHCSECRYVVKRNWAIPTVAVDCNLNQNHNQALTRPPPRSRAVPDHLLPYITGQQFPRRPFWREDRLFLSYSKWRHSLLR